MATTATRLGALGMLTALVVGACSGGFGGAVTDRRTGERSRRPRPRPAAPRPRPSPERGGASPSRSPTSSTTTTSRQARLQGLIDAYTALHPNVTIEIETHPGGTEGDNLVKTRLATGDMPDMFYYNSGSLLQALNPSDTLVDLSRTSRSSPTSRSRTCRRSPRTAASTASRPRARSGGGILYNKKIYSDLGLTGAQDLGRVRGQQRQDQAGRQGGRRSARPTATRGPRSCSCSPTTTTSRRRSRTSPRSTPPTRPTTPTRPAAQAGFQHLQEALRQGLVAEGLRRGQVRQRARSCWPTGKCAHYPMLTFARRHDRRELPGHDRRHRVLRPAGRRRRDQRRDDLDAGRDLHPQDHRPAPSSTRPRSS